jgi:hypothetical protein
MAGKDASISNADKVATLAVSDSKIGGKTSSTFDRLTHLLRIFSVHCDGRDPIHADGDARGSQTEPSAASAQSFLSAYYTAQARINYIALSMDHTRLQRPLSWCLYAERAMARRPGQDGVCPASRPPDNMTQTRDCNRQHRNLYKCKHQPEYRNEINSVFILHLFACELVQIGPVCVATWPMIRKRYVLSPSCPERAQAIGRARNTEHQTANYVLLMIALRFETPMGNNLCSPFECWPVPLNQTFMPKQGAPTLNKHGCY